MSLVHQVSKAAALSLVLILIVPASSLAMTCEQTDVLSTSDAANSNNASASILAQNAYSHQFDSGARWDFCWHIDQQAGLTISNIHYGPPAEPSTRIMDSASLAQILFKYDEDPDANHILSSHGLGGKNHISPDTNNCATGTRHVSGNGTGICTHLRDVNTMTSVRRSAALRRHELSVRALSTVEAQTYEQVWRFSEDGQITPAVRVSGELDRFTHKQQYGSAISNWGPLAANAALLFTWRLDFNIGDTPFNDIVEQVEFVPHVSQVVRRSLTRQEVSTESFHKVKRTHFRGWLVRDSDLSAGPGRATRMGYYLDPQSSGFDYVSRRNNWALFDFSVTRNNECEKLASLNDSHNPECGSSLDQFVNGESLTDQNPVVWFSLARQFLPKAEDYPAITAREASFRLIPFDWSASTPFSPLQE